VPIVHQESPQPLTPASRDVAPVLVESDEYRQVCRELLRYVRGETQGRSLLIAGHRGAGKTTLVSKAIQDVTLDRFKDDEGAVAVAHAIPLRVPMRGPAMLPAAASEKETAELALRAITAALYRALSEEVHERYRAKASGVTKAEHEAVELAAQFRLRLDEAPGPAELRDFWTRLDILRGGLLGDVLPRPDQGFRELIALATAAQAYRIVSGESTRKDTTSTLDEAERETTTTINSKDLMNGLTGLFSGAAVFFGLSGGVTHPSGGAAAGGIAAALATTALLSYTSSRKRKRAAESSYEFLRDSRVVTLERDLPVLIERIKAAGFYPVFVVDELDKVDNLHKRMQSLVSQLKSFVAEEAFFCFLTDRNYFEYLRSLSRRMAYPPEHTYFSRRMLIQYRPGDLRRYLYQTFESSPDSVFDWQALPFALLRRACLHHIDLRREISALRGGGRELALQNGEVTSTLAFKFDITIQLAIDLLLARDDLRTRLKNDPDFVLVAYDALYYPSRCWEDGRPQLDTSESAFRAYLGDRMRLNEPAVRSNTEGAITGWTRQQPESHAEPADDVSISDADLKFLHTQLQLLVEFLNEPSRLKSELLAGPLTVSDNADELRQRTDVIAKTAVEAIPPNRPVLKRVDGQVDQWAWTYDSHGRPLNKDDEVAAEQTAEHWEFIQEVRGALERLAGPEINFPALAELYLLERAPEWNTIEAMWSEDRLRGFVERRRDYSTRPTEQLELEEFVQNLRGRATMLGLSLIYGARISSISDRELLPGVRSVSEGLLFRMRSAEDIVKDLEERLEPQQLRPPEPLTLGEEPETDWANPTQANRARTERERKVAAWTSQIQAALQKARGIKAAGSDEPVPVPKSASQSGPAAPDSTNGSEPGAKKGEDRLHAT
jgi:hypothetical protein